MDEDIVKQTEKFNKQNSKGKLSPNDIEKWNEKLAKMKEKSAEQKKRVEKMSK